jgi:sec-independent protein translocase protein TatB
MFDIGFWEIFLISLILLIVLGPERMPELAKTAGKYIRKIKDFTGKISQEIESEIESENLKKHLSLEDENSSILEIIEDSKETLNDIKNQSQDK